MAARWPSRLGAGYVPSLGRAQDDGEFPETGAFPDLDFREGLQSRGGRPALGAHGLLAQATGANFRLGW